MKLADITKPIDLMTDDELIEKLRQVRHNRETIRPARAKIIEKAATKITRAKTKKTEDLFDKLTPEERAKLIAQLEG